MHINDHAVGVEDFDFAGSSIEVYVFEDADGNMDSYYTVDPMLAKQYAIEHNLAWIARKFEYIDSELVKDYRKEEEEDLDEFWDLVESANWATNHDYNSIEVEFMKVLDFDKEKINNFRDTFSNLKGKLYQKTEGVSLGLGDDGTDDLLSHIIGLGREEYNRALSDTALIKDRAENFNFVESFSYAVPGSISLDKLSLQMYVSWARDVRKHYETASKHEFVPEPVKNTCKRIADILSSLSDKQDFKLFLEYQSETEDLLMKVKEFTSSVQISDLDISNEWAVKNLFSDIRTYKDFML